MATIPNELLEQGRGACSFLFEVREGLGAIYLSPRAASLFPGELLGEKVDLDKDQELSLLLLELHMAGFSSWAREKHGVQDRVLDADGRLLECTFLSGGSRFRWKLVGAKANIT